MKMTAEIWLLSNYNDGTNIGSYKYIIAKVPISMLASTSWRLRAFKCKLPSTSKTVYATAIMSTTAGTLPAAAGRSVAITSAGKYTLGSNETLGTNSIRVNIVCSDVEDDVYPSKALMGISDTNVAAANGSTDVADKWIAITFGSESSSTYVQFTMTSSMISNTQLPSVLALYIADYDLVTRDYSGKWMELGAKALTVLAQTASRQYAGLTSQVAGYLVSNNQPHVMELNAYVHDITIGVGI